MSRNIDFFLCKADTKDLSGSVMEHHTNEMVRATSVNSTIKLD
jgi:hypothetical protein